MSKRLDPARPRSIVAWAVLVGMIAGISAAVYHSIVAEPLIDDAIALEEARTAVTEHGAPEPEQVSRSTQRGVGLFVGYTLLGGAYALVASVTALALRGSWLHPFRRSLLAGAMLAGALTVVPWFKYPPNPPAVGDPDTAGERQGLYWLLVVLTGLVVAGAAHLSSRLRDRRWPDTRRTAAVAAATAVVLGTLLVLMPPISDPIPADVPADLIWRFRVASLGGNLLLWGLLTVGFGLLWAEAQARGRSPVEASASGTAPRDAAPAASAVADQNSMPFRAETPLS